MAVTEGTILRVVASLLFADDVVMQNVFHLVLTQIVGDNDAEDVVADMVEYIEGVYANMNSGIDSSVQATDVKVYEYDSGDDDFDEVGTDVWTDGFAGSGETLPHGVAGVINLYTLDPDTQGRKFFGGLIIDYISEGGWDSSSLTMFGNTGADIVAQFTSGSTSNVYTPGVWSPTHTVFRAFSGSYSVPGAPGYQRRRKPGVGI